MFVVVGHITAFSPILSTLRFAIYSFISKSLFPLVETMGALLPTVYWVSSSYTIITLCSQNNLVVKDTNNVKGDYSVFIFFYLKIPQMFSILATCNLGVSTKFFYRFHNTFKMKLKTLFDIVFNEASDN